MSKKKNKLTKSSRNKGCPYNMERARLKQTTSTNLHSEKMITIEIKKKRKL